jgi:hypothetical protein
MKTILSLNTKHENIDQKKLLINLNMRKFINIQILKYIKY